MIAPDELRALCQRVIQSGELGRSRTYASILEYLAEQAISGSTPKEISIAMDVLGRGSDFDVGKDSIVRVHIYHLRNKLNAYYAKHGREEQFLIEIPKGQYMLASTLNTRNEQVQENGLSITGKPLLRASFTPWLAAIVLVLVLFDLYTRWTADTAVGTNPYAATTLWQPILDDERPVLVLVGDYYIMGEQNNGIVSRMVREFDINSQQDLQTAKRNGEYSDYLNLDLSYIPTSVANAMAQVMKVFGADSNRVSVKLMSDFTTSDLVGNHVIYLGYLSGMQSLYDLMFAGSGLAMGQTFDELINIDEDTLYTSSSGLSTGDDTYRDYGMLSTFPAPGGTQYLFLAGLRDEGLENLAREVTMMPALEQLESLKSGDNNEVAFEALYEVLGFSNTNIDAELVYSQRLDTEVLWQNRLIGGL